MKTQNITFSSLALVLSISLIIVCPYAFGAQAQAQAQAPAAKFCMVYAETPQGEQPEAFHLRVLAAALGSDQAAKDGLIYSYKEAASGFSAVLSEEQQKIIEKQVGVISLNCNVA